MTDIEINIILGVSAFVFLLIVGVILLFTRWNDQLLGLIIISMVIMSLLFTNTNFKKIELKLGNVSAKVQK